MNFDIEKIKKIPKLKPYKEESLEKWIDFLGGAEYQKKPLYTLNKVKIEAIDYYTDTWLNKNIVPGDIYEVDEQRADDIVKAKFAKYYVG